MQIQDKTQAVMFEHPLKRRLLMACAHRERTVRDLAEEMACPIQKAHYHVRTLVDCGLLRIARTEPRGGRPIKHYRSVADSFFIPNALADDPDRELWERMRSTFEDAWQRSDGGRRISFGADGRMKQEKVPARHEPEGLQAEAWLAVHLSPQDMRALHRDLAARVKAAAAEASSTDAKPFLVHLAAVPFKRT